MSAELPSTEQIFTETSRLVPLKYIACDHWSTLMSGFLTNIINKESQKGILHHAHAPNRESLPLKLEGQIGVTDAVGSCHMAT